jgi:Zn-finger in ubiquitin-hydrolases and other protein
MATTCGHLGDAAADVQPSADGCEDCLRVGGTWVHLRMCRICGHIGCCDASPAKHATAHHASSSHPLISSFEPGEDWWWCYDDEVGFVQPDQPIFSHR